ncbi:FABP family protein [Flexivirga endophytica]|uniref:FABP family protein n=1 Tax=Flexivirga endophytica TaxID=1849103 RepID=A0A916TJI9_9MICO|nr:FABP family protein [Flexivirga endophytica]GGB46428.1 FABP family protein [Flexivirga endophytica]GHB70201.1 FABP family protein [Flexivirga endophytica]
MPATIQGPQKLGPLTPLVGEWEGDVGVDLSYHNKEDDTSETSYFEQAWFKPIPVQENGQQEIWGLSYGMKAWRHGEEAMDPFHDEIGFLLWDRVRQQVMRNVVFGRGIAILAGSTAGPRDTEMRFDARPGAADYGILQNPYLLERAQLMSFDSAFTIKDDQTFSYTSDLVLKLAATGVEMHHTDENTLQRVKRYHPSAAA